MPTPTPLHTLTQDAVAPSWWERPDPALAAAGIEGEFVVARVRVIVMALLLIAPTWNVLHFPGQLLHVTGFSVTLVAALTSVWIWWRLRDGRWRPWVGFASSAFDVSMVSLALVSFMLVASPLAALNSTVTFEMYFLAIVATSLRYDARICIAIGGLTLAEFGGLWLYASARHNLYDPAYATLSGPYTPVDLSTRLILLAVATLLAVTIVRRAQRLLYLAARDRLTGLFNRGHFDRALAAAANQAHRDHKPLALAILDIDHFKDINDRHGHACGDLALRQLAEMLQRAMRRTDTVARYGGEEFVILMPGTSRDRALARVELLRREVSETPLALPDGTVLRVNFSAGVAASPDDVSADQPAALLQAADLRLLAAKRNGRAQCVGEDTREPTDGSGQTTAARVLQRER